MRTMTFTLVKNAATLALVFASTACASTPARSPKSSTAQAAPPTEAAAQQQLGERVAADAEFRKQPPQPAPDPHFNIPKVERFKLSNGLPVILASDRDLPLVYVQVVVRTGGLADPVGKAGLADLTADMLDEGTSNRSALQISADIEQLGASLATGAARDYSVVSVSGLSEVMDRALPVWADVLLNPAFADEELARVRENRMAVFQRRKDSPPSLAAIVFGRAIYGEQHPLGWPETGSEETLPQLSVAELKRFHKSYFQPNNAVLVVAGDMDQAGVRKLIEPLLKGWKGKAQTPRAVPAPKPLKKTSIFLVNKAQAPQSSIRMGLPALPRKHPDYYKAGVMNEILGGSFRRLSLNLREQKGWTYGVYSKFVPYQVAGPWQIYGEFVANKTAESVTELLGEVERIRKEDVPAVELQEAKDALIRAFPAQFSTMPQLADQMANLFVYNLPDNELESFQAKVAAVTAQDVRDMARKYLLPQQMAIVVVGDQASVQAPLSQIAEVELRDIDGKPVKP